RDRLATAAGAQQVAAANVVPALDSNSSRPIEVAGQPIPDASKRPRVDYRQVSPRYFDVLKLPILSGRGFADGDQKSAEPVAIVSESLARKFWQAGQAIGERVRVNDG